MKINHEMIKLNCCGEIPLFSSEGHATSRQRHRVTCYVTTSQQNKNKIAGCRKINTEYPSFQCQAFNIYLQSRNSQNSNKLSHHSIGLRSIIQCFLQFFEDEVFLVLLDDCDLFERCRRAACDHHDNVRHGSPLLLGSLQHRSLQRQSSQHRQHLQPRYAITKTITGAFCDQRLICDVLLQYQWLK